MSTTFFIILSVLLFLVLLVLIIGVISMAKGGPFNKKYGNKLMQARVYLQGAAIVLFVLAIMAARH